MSPNLKCFLPFNYAPYEFKAGIMSFLGSLFIIVWVVGDEAGN